MLYALIVISIIAQIITQPLGLNYTIAIQNEYQQYFSYLPYIQTCNYNQSNFYPGAATITEITNTAFYQTIDYEGTVSFWRPVYKGFDIAILLKSQKYNYSGYLLYDSPYIAFQRQIVFFTLNQTNLTFSYAVPSLNQQNMTLNITITSTVPIQLPSTAWQILNECGTSNSSNFAYLGNHSFIYVCGAAAAGFSFVPTVNNESEVQIYNFSESIGVGNYRITSNPALFESIVSYKIVLWNALLQVNVNQQTTLYFVNKVKGELAVTQFSKSQRQINQIFDKIWGQQYQKQISKWMDLFSSIDPQLYVFIPGDLVSVFVSNKEDIYIESQLNGTHYLCVFNSRGQLFQNVSFEGQIFFYGPQLTFIYNQETNKFYTLSVQRPIYVINISQFGNETVVSHYSTTSVVIPCQYVNITIFYQILWTSPNYPSGHVKLRSNQTISSTDSSIAVEVSDWFEIIGPAYTIIPSPPNNIQILVLGSTIFGIDYELVGIVNVEIYTYDTFVIVIATNNSIYEIDSQSRVKKIISNPCGFYQISSAAFVNQSYYEITNPSGIVCLCYQNFQICGIYQGSHERNLSQQIQSNQGQSLFSSPVKKNLFQIARKGMAVSILQDNYVILWNITNKITLDIIKMDCAKKNTTNGIIFQKQFYDPFLILFCEQYPSINQYVIRQNKIIPMRVIPIYRFLTKTSIDSIRQSDKYIFLEVSPTMQFYPPITDCCILRLDPCQFTVSVIKQIIQGQTILGTFSQRNFDVIFLNSNPSHSQSKCIVKVYYANQWLVFNLSNFSNTFTNQQQARINFVSTVYNFDSYYNLNVQFNLTNANLNLTREKKKKKSSYQSLINFNISYDTNLNTIYKSQFVYNLSNYICGPIFNSYFIRSDDQIKTLQIQYIDVITKSKLIGNIDIDFLQIIDPFDWGQSNYTLNNLLIFVSIESMYIYSKVINDIQMVFLIQFKLPQKACTYYIYSIVNNTAATLNGQCQGFNSKFQQPLITLSYNIQTNQFTKEFSSISMPYEMRDIYTIPFPNYTTIIGILEGPMNANTGKLIICQASNCSYLYVSTPLQFLINYDAIFYNTMDYYVITIDAESFQIFINPQVEPGVQKIMPNYIFNYSSLLQQQYCSVLKIVNVTQDQSFVIVSCTLYYYLLNLNFSSNGMSIQQKFARYSQCSLYDQFKPQLIISEQNGLEMIFAQCKENDYVLKLQTYQTVSSSDVIINTGFMQIFIMTGPLGPNCSHSSLSPAKIIPVAASMQRSLFIRYQIGKYYKFIYSQIKGILIDCYVTINPEVKIQYQPFTKNFNFPQIQFLAMNQFHYQNKTIFTGLVSSNKITTINIIVFIFFLAANAFNISCVICFFLERNKQKPKQQIDIQHEDQQIYYEQNEKTSGPKPFRDQQKIKKKQISDKKVTGQRKEKRVTEIQMFFVKQSLKRRQTQIKKQQKPIKQQDNSMFFDK